MEQGGAAVYYMAGETNMLTEANTRSLKDRRILVVEDEYFLADDLARALRDAGAEPVGPVGSLDEASIRLDEAVIDGCLLDMNLHGQMAFELAERIVMTGLPCVIVSGYGEQSLPPGLATVARVEKPVDARVVVARLADQFGAAP